MCNVDAEIEKPKSFCQNFILIIMGPETNLCTLWKQKYIYLVYFVLGLLRWLIQVVYIVEAKIQMWRIFFWKPGMTHLGLICVQCGWKNIDTYIFFAQSPWWKYIESCVHCGSRNRDTQIILFKFHPHYSEGWVPRIITHKTLESCVHCGRKNIYIPNFLLSSFY